MRLALAAATLCVYTACIPVAPIPGGSPDGGGAPAPDLSPSVGSDGPPDLSTGSGTECNPMNSCAVDFPCANESVCQGDGVQRCTSNAYNGYSPQCAVICGNGFLCCYGRASASKPEEIRMRGHPGSRCLPMRLSVASWRRSSWWARA